MHHPRIVSTLFFLAMLIYLPELLWNLRQARAGNFEAENVAEALRPQLGAHPLTSAVLLPVSRAPSTLTRLTLGASRIAGRMLALDRVEARVSGAEVAA